MEGDILFRQTTRDAQSLSSNRPLYERGVNLKFTDDQPFLFDVNSETTAAVLTRAVGRQWGKAVRRQWGEAVGGGKAEAGRQWGRVCNIGAHQWGRSMTLPNKAHLPQLLELCGDLQILGLSDSARASTCWLRPSPSPHSQVTEREAFRPLQKVTERPHPFIDLR